MREKRIARIYHRELFAAIALYAVLLTAAIHFGKTMAPGALRTVILTTPMIGFGAAIWAIARHLWRQDEYMRRRLMENIALAAAITAGLTFTYGFLELAGFPRLSMFTVWCVLCGATGVVQLVRKLTNR
ncbi:hypothetical protein [Massilia niabensis]|uniref:Transmembrane protein n=1 Tax=Massilia niabensis TaxID=544910 RepID=A0ABW0LEK1_9BURK